MDIVATTLPSRLDVAELSLQSASVKPEKSFESYLMSEINNVNNKIQTAETNLTDLASGTNTNIHEVMLSIEEAKLSLNMLIQVRNKALEGVQEILRMQV